MKYSNSKTNKRVNNMYHSSHFIEYEDPRPIIEDRMLYVQNSLLWKKIENIQFDFEKQAYGKDKMNVRIIKSLWEDKRIEELDRMQEDENFSALCILAQVHILIEAHNLWASKWMCPDTEYHTIISKLLDLVKRKEVDLKDDLKKILKKKLQIASLYYFDPLGIQLRLLDLTHHMNFTKEDLVEYMRESKYLDKLLRTEWEDYSHLASFCKSTSSYFSTSIYSEDQKMKVWFLQEDWNGKKLILYIRYKESGIITVELSLLHYLSQNITPSRRLALCKFVLLTGKSRVTQIFGSKNLSAIRAIPVGHNSVFPIDHVRYRDWNVEISLEKRMQLLSKKIRVNKYTV